VPVDLPPLQSGKLALVMLRLHADFRQRHGLPPVPSIADDLDQARRRVVLNEPNVLHSPRPVFGQAIAGARRVFWQILKPVFDRQTDMNRSLIRVLEALLAEREHHRHVHYDLSLRVAELERRLRLAEREHESRDRQA
jgi:hypothetical protein